MVSAYREGFLVRPFNSYVRTLSFIGLFVVFFTLALRAIAPGPTAAPDFSPGEAGPEVVIEILPGATGSEIAEQLFAKGVVKSSLSYFRAAVSNPESNRIAPGEHRIETRIPAKTALSQLLDPNRIVNLLRVRDGSRVQEIREDLNKFGFKEKEITAAIKDLELPKEFSSISPNNPNRAEGLLYPAFYSIQKGERVPSILQRMVSRFEISTSNLEWKYDKFSPYELLTIASLVESEGIPADFPKVAQVIYNRLKIGMPLQFDSTIHYIFERRGEIRLSIADTKVKSPYNTFQNRGLPPSPIGSPTKAAILATINPEPGPWLYFVTVMPKETKFTSDYKEFLKYKAEYKKNFANGEFE